MKIAIYARVSLPTKERDKVTQEMKFKQEIDNQLLPLRKYAANFNDWSITKEYIDRMTGKDSFRPQFKKLYEDAAKREFDLVLFWSLDRFSREGTRETLNHLHNLTQYGVKWKSYTEQFVDSIGPFGEAILGILAAVAKQERVRIVERTLAGLARAREQGRVGGRPRLITNREEIKDKFAKKWPIAKIARTFKMSRMSVYRIVRGKDAHSVQNPS